MNDEWIVKCGVRFWGERQLTEAIWTSYAGSVFLGLMAVVFIVVGVVIAVRGDDWMDRFTGLAIALINSIMVIPVAALWSDASCYGS